MRTPFVAANWKMFKTVAEAVAYVRQFTGLVSGIDDVEIVVAPPFTAVHAAAEAARGSRVGIAGHDLFLGSRGGVHRRGQRRELREAGARYVIIGHSERRTKFGETDEHVNRKLKAALAGRLTPIVCIGETLGERERNETLGARSPDQDRARRVSANQVAALAVAYEPVWAMARAGPRRLRRPRRRTRTSAGRLREGFGAEAGDAAASFTAAA